MNHNQTISDYPKFARTLKARDSLLYIILFTFILGCSLPVKITEESTKNPFLVDLNVPIDYASVTPRHIEQYAQITLENVVAAVDKIKQIDVPTFENVIVAMDDIDSQLNIANNNCFMLYWVSPDSLSRVTGFKGYQLLDSLATALYSDKSLYNKMQQFTTTEAYTQLAGSRKILVDDMLQSFEQSGVNLEENKLTQFKQLIKEIGELSSNYSNNMNTANDVLILDEMGVAGLPNNFKTTYKTAEATYEIPIISATRRTVTRNAESEATRKAFYFKYYNRAADTNLDILDSLVQKRYELAQLMGYESYATYYLTNKMAKDPATVWNFINDLIERSKEKAKSDIETLKTLKQNDPANDQSSPFRPWDISYYNNQILKTQYQVDHEQIKEYLPMESCLEGTFTIYQELLGLEFRKVENPSVWHSEVEMYEVYEGTKLKGRFYLDLFPRPNKESWFYGVSLTPGKATPQGQEVPVSMLLGNFTRPTETLPSLLSHGELNTLFHEFGHIVEGMSYDGEFASLRGSKADFGEAMSQLFENWIWDYNTLSTFARHYKTGEVLPKDLFDNMLRAKNLSSGLFTQSGLRRCVYDLNLYDKYRPGSPLDTDEIWRNIDQDFGVMPMHVEGTHLQASWIHVNTHPVYYYGYLWSEVYAQDMFTVFEKNGLTNQATGIKYRKLILANGTQRDIIKAVEEFLGRPTNNEAYIRSLGLD